MNPNIFTLDPIARLPAPKPVNVPSTQAARNGSKAQRSPKWCRLVNFTSLEKPVRDGIEEGGPPHLTFRLTSFKTRTRQA